MMKRIKHKIAALLVIATTLITAGCKAPALLPTEKMQLPETYVYEDTDTTTISKIPWKSFFPDTLLITYIETALANNHSFLKTIEQISIARSQLKVAKGALLPEITLGVSGGIQRFGEYTMDGVGNSTTNTPDLVKDKHIPDPYKDLNLGINFSWEADILGKLTDKKRASFSRWMQSVEAKRLAQTLLISEVASYYFDLVGLDSQENILEQAIEKTQESIELTNELMKEGEVTRLSVDQFRSRHLRLEEMLLDVRQQIAETERAMAQLMGVLPMQIYRASINQVYHYTFPIETGIPTQLLRLRPDIRMAELELLATKSDLSAAKKAFYPSLRLGGAGGFNAFNLSKWFSAPASMVYNLAAGITAPLFQKNEIRAMWDNAKSNQKIALLNYHETTLNAYKEVVDLMTATEQMRQRTELKEEESRIHHRSIYNAKELFHSEFVGYLEVLSADEGYLNCELERINLNIEKCKLHVMLYRALGGGTF